MMVLGTWGAGWAGYRWGPWAALVAAVVGALVLAGVAVDMLRRRRRRVAGVTLGFAAGALLSWALLERLPGELVAVTPYIVTLVVLAASSQRLRPPAAAGRPYRRGEE